MTSSTFPCPSCQQPLVLDSNNEARCGTCTASFHLVPAPLTATRSLPATNDLPATVDDGTTVTYESSVRGEPRDDRAPPGYEILGELGRGGMGGVYRARHLRLDRLCALKMILAGGHAGETERQRFETEARAIARLPHPGIVQVFEVGEHGGHPFMALELCEGGSLAQKAMTRTTNPVALQSLA